MRRAARAAMAALAASPLSALEGTGLLQSVAEALSTDEDALFFALACRACRDAVRADPRFALVGGRRFRTANAGVAVSVGRLAWALAQPERPAWPTLERGEAASTAVCRRVAARPRSPVTAIRPSPQQHLQVPHCMQRGPSCSCSRPPSTTAALPGVRLSPQHGMCHPSSAGSRSPRPTAAPPGARLPQPQCMCRCPTGSRSPEPTGAPPGARPPPRPRMSAGPTRAPGPSAPTPKPPPSPLAARDGYLDVLQWARANGCDWSASTCSAAARGGHLEVLQWLRENGCDWNWQTCEAAAFHGHLEVLQWARANGCEWDWQTCRAAAGGRAPGGAAVGSGERLWLEL
eukprot:SAG22_NODE_11_length_35583_cov_107.128790_29_plen_345_part_00